ncbi:DUF2059 domain-containing protein [Salidesulfovibrio onnuriiensis]|uniref:DUF2059 domain-containing protein n=1 Tax=Salidesulfovibrio onnuriiensis TaxID=2583823 RepID=UPI0011C803D0|nr:DUF2059 domain-containing protein [Salidesulfovibrio onnuriiensis]
MKKIAIVLFVLLLVPAFAQAGDIDKARMDAATKFIELQDMKKVLKQMFDATTKMMPESEMKKMQTKFYDRLNYERIEQGCILAAARNFSLKELNAMIDFYSTPVGKSIISKQGAYSAEAGAVVQQEVVMVMTQIMGETGSEKPDSSM